MLTALLPNNLKIGRPASMVVIRKQNECHKSVTRMRGRIIWERDPPADPVWPAPKNARHGPGS